ncbi:hydrogenase expression/formation protein HypE [Pectinatus brassicae]|uniref:Hydrogenase expression/formation protein HypE n=2 Tax=Pectinatus brassicae TaxID=862415 RepID=A0A840UCE3_9FIRM|nr:hydrogenase expression/formation protein HypE [Pectinatus brassicae]
MPGINMDKAGIIMDDKFITLAHGAGGLKSRELVEEVMLPAFDNEYLRQMHDGAKLQMTNNIAFTTDSYVVQPLFFNGGNIGKLAVCGTVNDLAMTGAVPKYISVGMIIEEGFAIADLQKIVMTMKEAAAEAGVHIVTGDTKVVDKNKGDGIFINTAGVGEIIQGCDIAPQNVKAGMDVIASGYLGDHAATIMACRHNLQMPGTLKSDCAPLNKLVEKLLQEVPQIAVMRDATRGGAAAVLNEIAGQAGIGIIIDEDKIPVRKEVNGFCDILGFEPLYLANEGKFITFVDKKYTEKVLAVMHQSEYGKDACVIGETNDKAVNEVVLRTTIGGMRIIDMPAGEQIPRIC